MRSAVDERAKNRQVSLLSKLMLHLKFRPHPSKLEEKIVENTNI